jgi:hypothetical protein
VAFGARIVAAALIETMMFFFEKFYEDTSNDSVRFFLGFARLLLGGLIASFSEWAVQFY